MELVVFSETWHPLGGRGTSFRLLVNKFLGLPSWLHTISLRSDQPGFATGERNTDAADGMLSEGGPLTE